MLNLWVCIFSRRQASGTLCRVFVILSFESCIRTGRCSKKSYQYRWYLYSCISFVIITTLLKTSSASLKNLPYQNCEVWQSIVSEILILLHYSMLSQVSQQYLILTFNLSLQPLSPNLCRRIDVVKHCRIFIQVFNNLLLVFSLRRNYCRYQRRKILHTAKCDWNVNNIQLKLDCCGSLPVEIYSTVSSITTCCTVTDAIHFSGRTLYIVIWTLWQTLA